MNFLSSEVLKLCLSSTELYSISDVVIRVLDLKDNILHNQRELFDESRMFISEEKYLKILDFENST